MQDDTLETQADLLADAALHELGEDPFDDVDEYDGQCDYAGCYPWLTEFIHANPHESRLPTAPFRGDAAEDDSAFTC